MTKAVLERGETIYEWWNSVENNILIMMFIMKKMKHLFFGNTIWNWVLFAEGGEAYNSTLKCWYTNKWENINCDLWDSESSKLKLLHSFGSVLGKMMWKQGSYTQ